MSLVFITHDLAVLSQIATHGVVLEDGRVVETRAGLAAAERARRPRSPRGCCATRRRRSGARGAAEHSRRSETWNPERRSCAPRPHPPLSGPKATLFERAATRRRSTTPTSTCAQVPRSASSASPGSGKSTLVRLLLALDTPTAGTVEFDGRPVDAAASARVAALAAPRDRHRLPGSLRVARSAHERRADHRRAAVGARDRGRPTRPGARGARGGRTRSRPWPTASRTSSRAGSASASLAEAYDVPWEGARTSPTPPPSSG